MNRPNRIYRGDYIKGQFIKVPDPNGEIQSQNPGDLEAAPVAIPFGFEHIDDAIRTARASFPAWQRRKREDRLLAIRQYCDLLKVRKNELAWMNSFETGKPLWEALDEVSLAELFIEELIPEFEAYESSITLSGGGANGCQAQVRFFPRGVFAVLAPPHSPILNPITHFIPALYFGNTVLLKTSKFAPLTGQIMAELFHDSGMAAGVLNVVHGDSEAARRIVSHPEVDGVCFTGSFEIASKIRKQTLSDFWKVLILESGGKNGTVIWHDANYEKALYETLTSAFLTTGQRCTSTSRILVHEKIFDTFLKDFHALSKQCLIGYGLSQSPVPFMGPMLSEVVLENYLRHQGIAVREGAEEIMRGKPLERERKGYYVSPSIHWVKTPDSKSVYQRSEILGPNVAFYKIKHLEEAAEILNLTQYGLVASLYSQNEDCFVHLSEDVHVGSFHWNVPTTAVDHRLPLGGIKKSGNARPMGSWARYQCTYPVATLRSQTSFNRALLPDSLPRLER